MMLPTKFEITNKRIIFLFVVSVFLLFSILFFLFLLFILFFQPVPFFSVFKEYQIMRIDPSRSITTFGTAKTTQTINSNEYFSYTEEGSTVFIQKSQGEYFSCLGNCYCNPQEKSRRTISGGANLLEKGIVMIISTLSVVLAMKISEESLTQYCKNEFSDSDLCDSEDDVDIMVEDCWGHDPPEHDFDLEREQETFGTRSSTNFIRYKCFGQCKQNENMEENEPYLKRFFSDEAVENFFSTNKKWMEKHGPCENLRLENYELVFDDEQISLFFDEGLDVDETSDFDKKLIKDQGKADFLENSLETYCRQLSSSFRNFGWGSDFVSQIEKADSPCVADTNPSRSFCKVDHVHWKGKNLLTQFE